LAGDKTDETRNQKFSKCGKMLPKEFWHTIEAEKPALKCPLCGNTKTWKIRGVTLLSGGFSSTTALNVDVGFQIQEEYSIL
jgi:hypothetical protein